MSVISESEAREGEKMSLKCLASGGRPLPTIQWTAPPDVEFLTSESSTLLVGQGKLASLKISILG